MMNQQSMITVRAKRLFQLVLFILLIGCSGHSVQAQSALNDTTPRLPGVKLAEGITEITGVAISPLFGVSAMGAWRYWRTPEAVRDQLPWYCHPYAWGFGFSLLGMCFLKDSFGTVAPPLLKKPLDVAELFEDKISALVASAGFVPLLASEMLNSSRITPAEAVLPPDAALPLVGQDVLLATVAPPLAEVSALSFLLVPLMIVLFLVVWLAGHAINVLIVLSPFGIVDGVLKLAKMALLGLVAASALLNPWLGLVVCIPIVLFAIWIAPWTFRLSVFGSWFGFDLLRFLRLERRQLQPIDSLRSFTSRGYRTKPVRTAGRLRKTSEGGLEFSSRKMGIVPLPADPLAVEGLVLVRGLWCPLLMQRVVDESGKEITKPLLLLSPRYRSREDEISAEFGFAEVQDGSVMTGFKAGRQWLRSMLIYRPEQTALS